jgi:hypothetical protein
MSEVKLIDEAAFLSLDSIVEQSEGYYIARKGDWQTAIFNGRVSPINVQIDTKTVIVTPATFDEAGNEVTPAVTKEEPVYETQQFNVWTLFQTLKTAGTISVVSLTAAEKAAIADAEAAAVAKRQQDLLKIAGADINGHTVSLTEKNQNGLAAVMQGANLAESAGDTIFPLNFNARTASGETSITFATKTEFEAFCLAFLQARQQFF